jgi:hypothetical protein
MPEHSFPPDRLPYVTAMSALQARLELTPLGLAIQAEHRFDPTHRASAPFLDLSWTSSSGSTRSAMERSA